TRCSPPAIAVRHRLLPAPTLDDELQPPESRTLARIGQPIVELAVADGCPQLAERERPRMQQGDLRKLLRSRRDRVTGVEPRIRAIDLDVSHGEPPDLLVVARERRADRVRAPVTVHSVPDAAPLVAIAGPVDRMLVRTTRLCIRQAEASL